MIDLKYNVVHERKMVLSGGILSPQMFHEIYELTGTDAPQFAVDASPCTSISDYNTKRKTWRIFSEHFKLPEPLWLQDEVDEPLSHSRVNAVLDRADVLLVTGGASRKAIGQWRQSGVHEDILERVNSGSIAAAGASAGAMIWFGRGLSDSNSYDVPSGHVWRYEPVEEAGLFRSDCMAHFAETDSLGRRKQALFEQFLKPREDWVYAVGIDSYAALVCVSGFAHVRDITPQSRATWGERANVTFYTERSPDPHILSDGDSIPLADF